MTTRIKVGLLVAALGLAACGDDDTVNPPATETFTATMTGAAERPPVTTNASGTATVTFNSSTSTFSYTMNVSGLTGVTAAHIHGPATTEVSAGILVPLTAPTSASVSGTFGAAQLTAAAGTIDALLELMRSGQTYINVHTTANATGEIRGQLIKQ